MRIYDDPKFLNLPEDVARLFSKTARSSFFNTQGWYNLVSRFGTRSGWRPQVIADDNLNAAFVLQLPVSAKLRELASCINAYSCEHAIIADGDAEIVSKLGTEIARSNPQRFRIQLAGLDPSEDAFAAAQEGLQKAGFATRPFFCWGNWFENVEGKTFDEYVDGRPSILASTWKRKLNALQKKNQAVFEICDSQDDLQLFSAAYDRVHAQSWKEQEPFPRFIPELIRHAASVGALRLGVLKIGGEPAAAQFWIVWRGNATIFKLVHADRFREFSPGTLLTMHMIKHIISKDAPSEIDFGRGDDEYKKLWVSSRRERWGIDGANLRTPRGAMLAAHMIAGRMRKSLFDLTGASRPR
jgi:Acetyltransferase (GNAT) domain